MGSVGKNSVYSEVDRRYTPMSDEAKDIVAGRHETRYFQSSDAFYINQALRIANDENISLDEALARVKDNAWWSDRDVNTAKNIIKTMDENMHPTDKDMKVVRMADTKFLNRILTQAKVPDALKDSIVKSMNTWGGKPSDQSLDELRSYLVGGTVYENGFMSTTHNLSLKDSAFTSRRIMIEADVHAGTKGMFSPTKLESEFVIDRHEGYKIKGIRVDDDNRLRLLVDVN